MLTRHLFMLSCIQLLVYGMIISSEQAATQKKHLHILEKLSAQMGELSVSLTGRAKQLMAALSDLELVAATKAAIEAKSTISGAMRDKFPLGPILSHILEIYASESFEPLGVYPQFLAEKFLLLASLIKEVTKLYTPPEAPVIVSYASGHLLLEYLLVTVLNKLGYKKMVLHTIDILYESPRTAVMRRLIDLTNLQDKFNLRTYSLAFQAQHIKNLFEAFIEKLKNQNISVKHCFAHWGNQRQPELHWGIWKSGADFIWTAKTYQAHYPLPLIFMTIQPSIPPYMYPAPFGLLEDFRDFLSFKVLAQKPCINDIRCIKNTSGCNKTSTSWQVVVPSGPFPPLLMLSQEDPTLLSQMNNLFTQISHHENITESVRALLQCQTYGAPADNPNITFYDMVALTAANEHAGAFYASLDKEGKYKQRVSSPPRSTHQFGQAIRTDSGAWYVWDGTEHMFRRMIFKEE